MSETEPYWDEFISRGVDMYAHLKSIKIIKVLIALLLVTAIIIPAMNIAAEQNPQLDEAQSEPTNSNSEPAISLDNIDTENNIRIEKMDSTEILSGLVINPETVESGQSSYSTHSIEDYYNIMGSGARSEPDDNENQAMELKHGDGNITGDVKSQVVGGQWTPLDVDWYKIYLHEFGPVKTEYVEITVNNSKAPTGSDERFVIEAYESFFTYMWGWPSGQGRQSRLDREMLNNYEEKNLGFSSPINGWVYIVIYAMDGAKIDYRINSVNISEITPPQHTDGNNYPGNATKPQTTSVNGKVIQHTDHWDWYDISQYFILEENYTNNITFSVDITNENRSSNEGWFSWTEVWLWCDDETGTQIIIYGYWGGSQDVQYSGNVPSEPITGWRNVPGTQAWIGIKVESGFLDGQGNLHRLGTADGWAEYTLNFAVDHVDLNTKPVLTTGSVDPLVGTTSEFFTFSVNYTDENGDPPALINVTIDGYDYPMSETSGGSYTTGKVYEKVIKGSTLTDYPYPHSYYFHAADYRANTRFPNPVAGDLQDLKIIDNEPVYVKDTAPKTLILEEDDEIHEIKLSDIFADPDADAELEYEVWVGPEADDFTVSYDSELLKTSFSTGVVKFKPKEDQHGVEEIRLRASDTFTYTDIIHSITDTYNFRACHNITVTINSVNDHPTLNYIIDQNLFEDEMFNFTITASDVDIDTDGDDLTFKTNVTDGLGSDDLPNFAIQPNITNPANEADITFLPTNENVGDIWVKISVTDQNESLDYLNVKFTVNNVNDVPEFLKLGDDNIVAGEEVKFISKSAATEDEWFNITLVVCDIDLDVGGNDKLTYETNITDGKGNDDLENFELIPDPENPEQAQIAFLPTNDDVGYLKFNLTVYDGMGGMNQTTVIIEIENVNDPPSTPIIVNPVAGNTTFSIVERINFTGDCDDPDLDNLDHNEELTFTWTSNVTTEVLGVGKTIFINDLEDLFGVGYIRITLTVTDKSEATRSKSLTIYVTYDLDNDGIWDDWEDEFGLNYRDKMDAFGDYDLDGFSNLEEFLGDDGKPGWEDSHNPWDAKDHPKKAETTDDLSWLWYILIIIVIVIVFLVIFGFFRKKKQLDEEEDEFHESYPGGGPGMKPISGVSPPIQPSPAFTPMMGAPPMGGTGGLPSTLPPLSMGMGASPFMPPLPPSSAESTIQPSEEDSRIGSGRSSPLAPTTVEDELSSSFYEPEIETEDLSISNKRGDEVKVWQPGGGGGETTKDHAKSKKCGNCGAEVQAGWFICPSCKNPLRSK